MGGLTAQTDMNRRTHSEFAKGAIELLEEAFHLLRQAPGGVLGCYFLGSLPFALGVLFFWGEMSRSAFAAESVVGWSAVMAGLFVWMKCWQSVYMRGLLAILCGETRPEWTLRRIMRLVGTQAAVQPWGLFAIPAAIAVILPIPWVYAFFQNAAVLGDGAPRSTIRRTISHAALQAATWSRQNVRGGLILALFGLFVFANLVHAVVVPAWIAKTFFGVESFFSMGGFSAMNSTFLATTFALTYLCVDPIVKAFYVLRCFYGLSLRTGEDLQADVKRMHPVRKVAAICLIAVLGVASSSSQGRETGDDAPAPPQAASTELAERLDDSIGQVIARPEYTWRMPREREDEEMTESTSSLRAFLDRIARAIERFLDWLFGDGGERESHGHSGASSVNWLSFVRMLIYVLLAIACAALVILIVQAIRKHRRTSARKAQALTAAQAAPDLKSEETTAADLPEAGWLDLARRMLSEGDRRLALRAMYLASLSLLAEKGMLAIAKFKSNREYHRELRRREHALPELVAAFGQNVGFFEDAWYGMHEVTDQTVNLFSANQERIRSIAGA